uniref:NTY1 n=1 Tax=Felis catus TaxID=9685 RepID=A0A3G7HPB4_FELCA|nr:NTY1 [Felis catus]AZD12943.1 NTY1 [Felis catus]
MAILRICKNVYFCGRRLSSLLHQAQQLRHRYYVVHRQPQILPSAGHLSLTSDRIFLCTSGHSGPDTIVVWRLSRAQEYCMPSSPGLLTSAFHDERDRSLRGTATFSRHYILRHGELAQDRSWGRFKRSGRRGKLGPPSPDPVSGALTTRADNALPPSAVEQGPRGRMRTGAVPRKPRRWLSLW